MNIKVTGLIIVVFLYALFNHGKLYAQTNLTAHNYLKNKSGNWTVTMTLRPGPEAAAIVVDSLAAERTMIGEFCLNETMHAAAGSGIPAFTRVADLAYNVNEQRWDYISIDTRVTAGIMSFTYQDISNDTITSFITSFPHPGFGTDKKYRGMAVHMRNVIISINKDHDMVQQFWRIADYPEWLAVQYDYIRQQ